MTIGHGGRAGWIKLIFPIEFAGTRVISPGGIGDSTACVRSVGRPFSLLCLRSSVSSRGEHKYDQVLDVRARKMRKATFAYLELPVCCLQQLFRLLPGTTCGQHELIDHHLLAKGVHFFRHVFPWTGKIPEGNEYTRETRARHSLPCRRALTMARVFVQTRARPASGEHPLVFKTKLIADGWRRRPPGVAERKRRGRCDVTASSIRESPCCLPCLGAFHAPCTLPAFDCLFSNAINNAKNHTTRERRCSYAIPGPCFLRGYYRASHFQSAAALLSWESSGMLTQK